MYPEKIQAFTVHYDRTCGVHLMGSRCTSGFARSAEAKWKKYGSVYQGLPTYIVPVGLPKIKANGVGRECRPYCMLPCWRLL